MDAVSWEPLDPIYSLETLEEETKNKKQNIFCDITTKQDKFA